MPFGAEFQAVYEEVIVRALGDSGFTVARADDFLDQHNILTDIIAGIEGSDLIVADLTGNNPNVFYELGIVHGLDKPVVLLTQEIGKVPFDLRSYRLVEYRPRGSGFADAYGRLTELMRLT